ncbi:hypothetical protein [Pleurocapsa sp. PCC 7319]|uniref:hypothetical protein n=1 Tax=Pleurocapsa sp. PCC 7319 TaxID=118161 RepID=UPI00034B837D|nr:hypothetical protein [Pleurocapsa sp. PCC 7319]
MKNRRLTPQQKKKYRYDKDYVLNVEYPHSFRKSWKDGMREKNRHYRRKVKQKFIDIDSCEDAVKSIRRKKCKKLSWDIITVRERVQTQLDQRQIRQAWSYFKQPYNSRFHRQDFVRFLSLLIESKSIQAQRAAWEIRDWLYPSSTDFYYRWNSLHHKWLREFFKDEPEWELRLKKWINSMLHARK